MPGTTVDGRPLASQGLRLVARLIDGILLAKARHEEVAPGRAELLVPDLARADAAKLALVGPDPAVIRACLPAMRQDRVALFRDW